MTDTPKRRHGRPLKSPETRKRYQLGVRVTAEVKHAVEQKAAVSGRSQAQEIELALEHYIGLEDRLRRIEDAIVGMAQVLGIRRAA